MGTTIGRGTGNRPYDVYDKAETVSKAQLLTEIKKIDGSGSGLDADLLDGLGSNRFIRSEAISRAIDNIDLNTLLMTQTCYAAHTCTNLPNSFPGYILVTGNSSNRVGQTFISQDGRKYYRRSDDGTSWAPWKKLIVSDDFTSSKAANGYQKLPSGLIIQWGEVPSATYAKGTNTTVSITFPLAFPTSLFISTFSITTKNVASDLTLSATKSVTGLDMNVNNSSGSGYTFSIDWLAIGY